MKIHRLWESVLRTTLAVAASLSSFTLTGYSGPINGLHLLGMNYLFGVSALGIQPQPATTIYWNCTLGLHVCSIILRANRSFCHFPKLRNCRLFLRSVHIQFPLWVSTSQNRRVLLHSVHHKQPIFTIPTNWNETL